jgi:hypothetical protein
MAARATLRLDTAPSGATIVENRCYMLAGGEPVMVVPWGEEAGAWRWEPGGRWVPWVPDLNIRRMEFAIARAAYSRRGVTARQQAAVDAYRFLLWHWPPRVRDSVRPFRRQNWRLIQFLNRGGGPAQELLDSNPALAFLAATAPGDLPAPLPILLAGSRRAILASFEFPASEAAVRILRKVDPRSVSEALLDLLRELTADPEARKPLSHLPRLNEAVLETLADRELRTVVSTRLLEEAARVPPGERAAEIAGRIAHWKEQARLHGRPLARLESLAALDRAWSGALGRAAPRTEKPSRDFPPPPIEENAHIRAIRTAEELRREGRQMHHCAGGSAQRVRSGRAYFYHLHEPENATVCIRPTPSGWRIEAARGACNRPVRPSTMDWLDRWLRGGQAPPPPAAGTAPAAVRLPCPAPPPRRPAPATESARHPPAGAAGSQLPLDFYPD